MIPSTISGTLGFHKFEMAPFDGRHVFDISFVSDNSVCATQELTYSEVSTLLKVFNAMKADGKYVPTMYVTDVTIGKQNAAEKKRKEAEQRRLDAGIPPKGYNTLAAAFIAAGWDMED